MNNPKMNCTLDKLFESRETVDEGVVKDKKVLDNLCDDFEKYLFKKKLFVDDLGLNNNKISIDLYGDWKHEHLYFKQLADKFFDEKGYNIKITTVEDDDDGDDCYRATHYIEVLESKITEEEAITSDIEEEAPVADRVPFEPYDSIKGRLSKQLFDKLYILMSKFTDTKLEGVIFQKRSSPEMELVNPQLIVYILNDNLSTADDNRGVVIVLKTPNKTIHLIDTEILDDGFYKNTVLYNGFELALMSKAVWVGDIYLKASYKDWRYEYE